MPRIGISYQDVASAANQLSGQEKNVTIENVRAILGTGSISTINNHLRKWKETHHSTQKIASKDNLPESLIATIKGLWESVITQSTDQFISIEETYKQEILELKNELEKYKTNNQRWQKLFDQWQQEKSALTNEKSTLEQALEFVHKENQSLNHKYDGAMQQLRDKQERIEELHQLHQQTQANLEHYRESAHEQRLFDQQQFEQEKHQLMLEMKNLKEQLIIQQQKYSERDRQYHSLSQSFDDLVKKHEQQVNLTNELADKFEQAKKNTIELQQTSAHWQSQCHTLETKLENKLAEYISQQVNNQTLNHQLADIKQLLQDSQNKNKLLAHEKWELAQEKARLVRQVKQLQQLPVT